jgi:hypothetical protein
MTHTHTKNKFTVDTNDDKEQAKESNDNKMIEVILLIFS